MDENFQLSDEEQEDGEEDDSEEGSDKDAEGDATDAKRAQQASGSHPLQQSFKAAAGELLKKYGVAPGDAPDDAGERGLRTRSTGDMS